MDNFVDLLIQLWPSYWHNWLVWLLDNMGFILAAIMFIFIPFFILKSLWLRYQLAQSIKILKKVKNSAKVTEVDVERISNQAMVIDRLSHSWLEYMQTLHPQHEVDDQGQMRVVRWRATAMAEVFFTEQALVDSPLKTEFYKHLPGILTGLGIIGTFSGLILGLAEFSTDQTIMRTSLAELIKTVGSAFQVSAAAIMLAILFTFIEKLTITSCYRQVEKLCQMIDSLFSTGAGEEYLLRLVQSSETSADQMLQIKDALVSDLRKVLSEVAVKQVRASDQQTQKMLQHFTKIFVNSLRKPMDRISQAVSLIGADQGEAVHQLLTNVLADFSTQMQDVFGNQMQDMSDMLLQSTQTLQSEINKFGQMAMERESNTARQSAKILEALTAQVEILGRRVVDATEATQTSSSLVAATSTEAIERMSKGAETLMVASNRFAKVSDQIATTMDSVGHLSQTLQTTAETLSVSSVNIQKVSTDYQAIMATFETVVR